MQVKYFHPLLFLVVFICINSECFAVKDEYSKVNVDSKSGDSGTSKTLDPEFGEELPDLNSEIFDIFKEELQVLDSAACHNILEDVLSVESDSGYDCVSTSDTISRFSYLSNDRPVSENLNVSGSSQLTEDTNKDLLPAVMINNQIILENTLKEPLISPRSSEDNQVTVFYSSDGVQEAIVVRHKVIHSDSITCLGSSLAPTSIIKEPDLSERTELSQENSTKKPDLKQCVEKISMLFNQYQYLNYKKIQQQFHSATGVERRFFDAIHILLGLRVLCIDHPTGLFFWNGLIQYSEDELEFPSETRSRSQEECESTRERRNKRVLFEMSKGFAKYACHRHSQNYFSQKKISDKDLRNMFPVTLQEINDKTKRLRQNEIRLVLQAIGFIKGDWRTGWTVEPSLIQPTQDDIL